MDEGEIRETVAVPLEELARDIARMAHSGQTDKNGEPYINHPERVAVYTRLTASGMSTEDRGFAIAAALLHDVIEDTQISFGFLRGAEIPEPVVEAVRLLTRFPDIPPEFYYREIRRNPIALAVKYADMIDNTDPARLGLLPENTQRRLRAKYQKGSECLGVHPMRWWEITAEARLLEQRLTTPLVP